jgi:hypothetical protein
VEINKCTFSQPIEKRYSTGLYKGTFRTSDDRFQSALATSLARDLCETECPKHAAPVLQAETRSRTRVSREPDGHRQRNIQRWSGLDHTINTIVAIFLAKVRRAISGRMPLASKAA